VNELHSTPGTSLKPVAPSSAATVGELCLFDLIGLSNDITTKSGLAETGVGVYVGTSLVNLASGALPLYDPASPYMESCIIVGETLDS